VSEGPSVPDVTGQPADHAGDGDAGHAEDAATGGAAAGAGTTFEDRLPYRIVRPYRVRFEESTANETMRTAIYLGWAADIAWQHSTALGFGRDWYSERGLYWLVRAVRLDVLRPTSTYADVLVSTQVLGYRRVAARRESEIRDPSGELTARLQIDWVMTNERGVPTRVPVDFQRFVAAETPAFEMHKVALPAEPPGAFQWPFRVRRRDLDPLDHVNNSVYLDYMEEALERAGQGSLLEAVPRRYVLDFAASAARDELLVSWAWPYDGGWAYRLVRQDGTDIFRARVGPL
jgi:medium-chain acyl-[acyl-carrier-protein] hydrolase